ncbi:MAG: DUF465 domain-containing protein [Nitrospinae bacterium CG11_big_fil_rev_8_21_14_0_20_45_15]|nr:MAG: DUF465 domain-containing protein [Nitrospinae bacterium CG11_big_fil_rev_8_21_14_0_20_45_15]
MEINEDLLEKLIKENHEFKKIHDQHSKLKSRVEELNKLKLITPEQEIEKKKHQKEKLILKDRMGEIVNQHQSS